MNTGEKRYQKYDMHAQMNMSKGVILPPHNFKHPSRWYYQLQKIKNKICSSLQWHKLHTKFLKIRSIIVF